MCNLTSIQSFAVGSKLRLLPYHISNLLPVKKEIRVLEASVGGEVTRSTPICAVHYFMLAPIWCLLALPKTHQRASVPSRSYQRRKRGTQLHRQRHEHARRDPEAVTWCTLF